MCLVAYPMQIGGCVLRRIFTLAILAIIVLWLLVSYLPGIQAILPVVAFGGNGLWMAGLAVVALIVFIGIQLWLVYTTIITVRGHQVKSPDSPFRLKLSVELFWTALPIVMTIGLAWASYALWLNLLKP